MILAGECPAFADDPAPLVDAKGDAAIPAQGAEIRHRAISPNKGAAQVRGCAALANDLTAVVDAKGEAAIPA